uniref:ABC-2 type transporter n=1 Tax=Glaucosphaera vacuolata TaxID=38265 RepID=UPI001FCCCB3E|nr:ABC-2 type transporter [Glaucosphaera vacuolata]UNJ18607.1 ABC-2 type transporter [Glaucosphaera vacuolata]
MNVYNFIMKYNIVLVPNWNMYQTRSYFVFLRVLQEVKSLVDRLFRQSFRRSATILASILQPLLWQLLFGAVSLFQKIRIETSNINLPYQLFLSSGIIVFTAFTSSMNAGLPIMFDREFGFLNRLLVIPLVSRLSILCSSILFMAVFSFMQAMLIVVGNLLYKTFEINYIQVTSISILLLLLIVCVTTFSFCLTFSLPGHIELLAIIFILNTPILFSTTALAPLDLMPKWLVYIASVNPLTYIIESIRVISLNNNLDHLNTIFGDISLYQVIYIFILLDMILLLLSNKFFNRKLE